MKNKTITITGDDLNTNVILEYDMRIAYTLDAETRYPEPTYIRIENNTNITISWNLFENDEERARYFLHPEYYQFLTLHPGSILHNDTGGYVYFFVTKNDLTQTAYGYITIFSVDGQWV